jgi:phosphohistidine phosphatase
MKLFIARHGQASFDAASDQERPLTKIGIDQTKELIQGNLPALQEVETIWSSTLVRAKQTASYYADALDLDVQVKSFLTPDSAVQLVLKRLHSFEGKSLLIVSHQPLVGELVSLLTEGNVYRAHPYGTSEVVVLECELPEAGLANIIGNYLPA